MKLGIREIIFLAVVLTIPVGAWWLVFRPKNARHEEMVREIEARQAKLQELNKATATLGDLKKEITALDEGVRFFRSKLPSEKEIDKVLQEVWRVAESNRLTTKSIRTGKSDSKPLFTDPASPYAEQPVSIELEGPFTGLYGFLLALESQSRIMRIQKMSVAKLPKEAEGRVRADCVVSVFFEKSRQE